MTSPAHDIFLSNHLVVENSAAGTVVGMLSTPDPDSGGFTFTLLDDADGQFVIDGTDLLVATPLDFEEQSFWIIKVQVTDSDNQTFQDTLAIAVRDLDGVTINGSQENDFIGAAKTTVGHKRATPEQDTIRGRGGNDNIHSAGGDDTIRGGAGNDKINGGLGADQLFGNAGADKFVFRSVADSLATAADTINDFSHSQHDTIDLRGVGADALGDGQHLTFIGDAAFSNHAGELRFDAGLQLVQVDVDGNGDADFAVRVIGTDHLDRADFIL
jgi:Ca2+-binding RTX toxin-like protein